MGHQVDLLAVVYQEVAFPVVAFLVVAFLVAVFQEVNQVVWQVEAYRVRSRPFSLEI